jgi:hypothetical protein
MIADRLDEISRKPQRNCPVRRMADSLDPVDGAKLLEVVENTDVALRQILNVLHDEGLKVSRDSLSHHRHGVCACKRDK